MRAVVKKSAQDKGRQRETAPARLGWILAVTVVAAGCATAPVGQRVEPPKVENRSKPGSRFVPGDYLTDHEKDYFQGEISFWAYYASPLFIGGNPVTENMRFWDRVDYEFIFFGNFPHSSCAMIKDLMLDWWISLPRTWYRQIVLYGFRSSDKVRGTRNVCLGFFDGIMDSAHELFDAVKIWDGHWKLPFHPGCTFEGGTRFLAFVVNKVLVEPTKPAKPLYYTLLPIGWSTDLIARGFNAGYLTGIKLCKWPPMLIESLVFGGWDLITFREKRGPFKDRKLPFSFKSGCVFYMYDGDMDYRKGPETPPSKPPRERRKSTEEDSDT